MRAEKRVNKDGTHYYSFVAADRKRMTREEIRNRFGKDILTEKEAKECLKLLQAKVSRFFVNRTFDASI